MIRSSEILDLLNEAEACFPLEKLRIAGVHAWPLLRIRYGFELIEGQVKRRSSQNGTTRSLTALAGPLRRFLARAQDHTRNASLTAPAEVVVLSDGISYASVGGSWVEKFCDPLIQEFERRDLRCLLLSPLHAYRVPRRTASVFVQPELDRIAMRAATVASDPEALHVFDDFQRWADAKHKPAPKLTWLRQSCLRVRLGAEFFGDVLRKTGAALGLVVNYYSPTGMAFVLACREQGIPVADIQHGVAGELHFAYGRWMRVPPGGFNLLPTYFWCWHPEDAAAITAWGWSGGHEALVGGNPWLAQWCGDDSQFGRETDRQVLTVMQRHSAAVHALVTLQAPIGTDHTPKMLELIRAGGPEVFWWVRLHPGQLAERRRIEAELLHTSHAEVTLATDLPLPALLRHVNVHVTHSSSSVLEAAAMGVPSVITSAYGAELYAGQMEAGLAVYAAGRPVLDCVREMAGRRRSLR